DVLNAVLRKVTIMRVDKGGRDGTETILQPQAKTPTLRVCVIREQHLRSRVPRTQASLSVSLRRSKEAAELDAVQRTKRTSVLKQNGLSRRSTGPGNSINPAPRILSFSELHHRAARQGGVAGDDGGSALEHMP